jgi:integrase
MKKRSDGAFGYERRRAWLRGGRIDVSLGRNRGEAAKGERALDLILDRRDGDLVEGIRSGRIAVAELVRAVQARDMDAALMQLREKVPGQSGASLRPDLSVDAMVDRVLAIKEGTKSAGTAAVYRVHTKPFLAQFRGRDITGIPSDDLRTYLYGPKGKDRKPWAPNTQRGAHMVLSFLWRLGIDLELEACDAARAAGLVMQPRITRNPWANIPHADLRTTRHAFLEPAEWEVLLMRSWGTPKAPMVALGCLAGLRAGEVQNLRPGIDVDWTADEVVIRVQPREGAHHWDTKHDHSIRDVPAVPRLVTVLREHERFFGDRYLIRLPGKDQPLGKTLFRDWTMEAFRAAGVKYGREGDGLTFHSLRHTFGSWLMRAGWSAELVAKLMGNTAKEVARTYMHLQPTDLRRVAMTIETTISGSAPAKNPAAS